jgi:hypothetical protein
VLKGTYPELTGLPVHTDGTSRWRYLDLGAARAPLAGCPLGAIVFPRYPNGAETRLDPITALRAD